MTTTESPIRTFSIITPSGTVEIDARDPRAARAWVTRHLPIVRRRDRATRERLNRADWHRITHHGTRGWELRVLDVDGNALDGAVRVIERNVVALTAPETHKAQHRVRHDVCTCEPKFSGNCVACQTAGIVPDRLAAVRAGASERTPVRREAWARLCDVCDRRATTRRPVALYADEHAYDANVIAHRDCAETVGLTLRTDDTTPETAAPKALKQSAHERMVRAALA